MKYSIAFLAAIAAVHGSPVALPQGVTSAISPSAPAPSGCMPNYSGSFGVAVMNMTGGGVQSATQLPDGQPQATSAPAPVSQITDGQPQASTGQMSVAPVTQISDGQIQATTKVTMAPVSQITDGQIQATYVPVTQISDGQIQATTGGPPPVSQISDGQIQATTAAPPPVTQISDGQIQATTAAPPPVTQISDGQIQATTAAPPPVTQISDGQIQATTAAPPPVTQISDGQIQATTAAPAVSQISDGQIQATTGPAVSQISDGQPQATASGPPMAKVTGTTQMVACSSPDTLTLTLEEGVLKDSKGRTGYIAANYQFQFDGPPQAGAIYTSGWSVCGNGSLALGGSTTFYQCLSGSFYNLYDRNWAAQCNAVTIDVLTLESCSS